MIIVKETIDGFSMSHTEDEVLLPEAIKKFSKIQKVGDSQFHRVVIRPPQEIEVYSRNKALDRTTIFSGSISEMSYLMNAMLLD